ncbi:MAG TPA: CsbD family protein [Thermoanaerobaculia bacterium]|nr:CsbD family protein [Thermoanaerobaculia bacterium]
MGLGERGDNNVDRGVGKQVEGKVNEVVGAAKGDLGQELSGKVEKNVGKVQEKLGHTEQRAAR